VSLSDQRHRGSVRAAITKTASATARTLTPSAVSLLTSAHSAALAIRVRPRSLISNKLSARARNS